MSKARVLRAAARDIAPHAWGQLTWYASARLGNCAEMTLGECVIKPGMANPKHSHPNCVEVLHVARGKIRHLIEDGQTVELSAGDTITIPPQMPHHAENIGSVDAVLLTAFSSGQRVFTPEA